MTEMCLPKRGKSNLLLDLLETRTKEFHLNQNHLTEIEQFYRSKFSILKNRPSRTAATYDLLALPSEIKFNRKVHGWSSALQPVDPPTQLIPWEIIKRTFGAFIILDEEAYLGVSILCTREPLLPWGLHLLYFPSSDTLVEDLASDDNLSLNSYLREVSTHVFLGEDGNIEPGWYCRNLLQAMAVMRYLDLIGGNTIRKCQSRGCPNYFRVGSQSKSMYCSKRCANRASTRMRRGQEP